MRWLLFFPLVLIVLEACNSNDKIVPVATGIFPDTLLAWDVNADSMIMKRDLTYPDSILTINRIINGLNDHYPEVHIDFQKQSNDTVFVSVPAADFLGEQMGDAGAAEWYADVVINLTSVPGVNYVSFQMDIHTHASSGVVGREKYNDWRKE